MLLRQAKVRKSAPSEWQSKEKEEDEAEEQEEEAAQKEEEEAEEGEADEAQARTPSPHFRGDEKSSHDHTGAKQKGTSDFGLFLLWLGQKGPRLCGTKDLCYMCKFYFGQVSFGQGLKKCSKRVRETERQEQAEEQEDVGCAFIVDAL